MPSPTPDLGATLIAFVAEDGNVWLTKRHGTGKRRLTEDGTPDRPYSSPRWSPDGSTLVLGRSAEGDSGEASSIYLYRRGQLTRVPTPRLDPEGTDCVSATFLPDGQRLAFVCFKPEMRVTVGTSRLDGTDWQVLIEDVGYDFWVGNLDFDKSGRLLLDVGGVDGYQATILGRLGGGLRVRLESAPEQALLSAVFDPANDAIVATSCSSCISIGEMDDLQEHIVRLGHDGSFVGTLLDLEPNQSAGSLSPSPDGKALVYEVRDYDPENGFDGASTIWVLTEDKTASLGPGSEPAWQPLPVAIR